MTDARCDRGDDGELEAPAGVEAGVRVFMMTDARCDRGDVADELGVTGVVIGVKTVIVTAPATVKVNATIRDSSATKMYFFRKKVGRIIILVLPIELGKPADLV